MTRRGAGSRNVIDESLHDDSNIMHNFFSKSMNGVGFSEVGDRSQERSLLSVLRNDEKTSFDIQNYDFYDEEEEGAKEIKYENDDDDEVVKVLNNKTSTKSQTTNETNLKPNEDHDLKRALEESRIQYEISRVQTTPEPQIQKKREEEIMSDEDRNLMKIAKETDWNFALVPFVKLKSTVERLKQREVSEPTIVIYEGYKKKLPHGDGILDYYYSEEEVQEALQKMGVGHETVTYVLSSLRKRYG